MKVLCKLNTNVIGIYECDCTKHCMTRAKRLMRIGCNVGTPVAGFVIDNDHENGLEEHIITNNAMIVIRNKETQKIVTLLVARPGQIARYYNALGLPVPSRMLDIAHKHQMANLNK